MNQCCLSSLSLCCWEAWTALQRAGFSSAPGVLTPKGWTRDASLDGPAFPKLEPLGEMG